MSFDLDKLQAVAELGEVIRLQNEALERLQAFRKARPHMMMPNLAKMVEENIKDNVTVLYKELNNLHKPAEKQTRYVCNDCHMAFISPLPGGICDECRARKGSGGPRQYVPYQGPSGDEEDDAAVAAQAANAASVDGEAAPVEEAAAESPAGQANTGNIEDLYAAAIAAEPDAEADEPSRDSSSAEAPSATDETSGDEVPAEIASEPADEPAGKPAETSAAEPDKRQRKAKPDAGDDFFDTPGDQVELANPAPEVAKPEGVEGIPDIGDDAGAGDRTS